MNEELNNITKENALLREKIAKLEEDNKQLLEQNRKFAFANAKIVESAFLKEVTPLS